MINAVGRNVMAIIKWTGLGFVPDRLLQLFHYAMQTSVLHQVLFLKKKILFPVSCISCFALITAWLLLSSFRCSNPHQLSNQHRLVHDAPAPHLAIIAKSLHNMELLVNISALLPHELSIANEHSRNQIMSSCLKATNTITCLFFVAKIQKKQDAIHQ